MKLIMLAIHSYHSANVHLPPRAIFGADGEPKLSWRVALLPYLDQGELYQAFHFDEPWDSPHNKALVARMPEVFTTPSFPAGIGMTRIRVFEGPGTMFDGSRGTKLSDVTDGTSSTVAIVVGRDEVAWTSPGDLPFALGRPLSGLDFANAKGVLVGMTDGSVHNLSGVREAFWKMLITPARGEVIDWSVAQNLTRQPQPPVDLRTPMPVTATPLMPASVNTTPASSIPPELDARLRAIETKLDQLMRKLEAGDKRPS
jgi:Protein of unknown function (DUF1559)